ncbi:MAG: DNA mismatch repair protein MutS [Endomicrobiales bacterium]|nr:DNA mismatch repair protein MutS [Endomicrobiales bacterium]
MPKMDTGTKKYNQKKQNSLTPLMQQYRLIKDKYQGMILLFRLGDFYEMFGDDAKRASPILEVVLTKRQGLPMCGVPYHSVNSYLRKLMKAGEKVAICEQLEEPRPGTKIVKRDVVRIITPGTILEENLLNAGRNNYLVAVFPDSNLSSFGIASIDISTGDFQVTETNADKLKQELFRLSPREIVVPGSYQNHHFFASIAKNSDFVISSAEDWLFSLEESRSKIKQFFKTISLKAFGLENNVLATCAAGGILAYLEKTQPQLSNETETSLKKPFFSTIKYYSLDNYLLLDETAIRNLELIEGQNTGTKENSLLGIIDLTLTPMGSRTLRQWLLKPLLEISEITKRQKAVGFLIEEGIVRRQIRNYLKSISDIERINNRIASGSAGPRDLIGLKNSLQILPKIKENLKTSLKLVNLPELVKRIDKNLNPPENIVNLISRAIIDEPPITFKEGGVIKNGFNSDLDELRSIKHEVKKYISDMESKERQRTGINNLKIGYTSVFGYYIEVTKSNLKLAPQEYTRKQTLTNCERFITPELKTFEEKILSAEEKILKLEEALFKEIKGRILESSNALKEIAEAISHLDVFSSFAEVSVLYNYCCPKIDDSYEIYIKDGRHSVIENKLKSGSFVPNDTYLNSDSDQIILLTGPNMAGKSTYLRQVALISILAQIGSYVPASEAKIGIIDRIFTRIGAQDNLASGESTFMVEMHETANILHQFTDRSLIILDEVGRGTSTYDGISIAWATIEYLVNKISLKKNPKVLFATHYFELTDLADKFPQIKNYNVSVKEWQDEVVFLHKIAEGPADRSYGIHVAQLAGLPQDVVTRAKNILLNLENKSASEIKDRPQLEFISYTNFDKNRAVPSEKILLELENLDLNNITPIEAMKFLSGLKKKVSDKKGDKK